MTSVLLALGAAVVYGLSDFLGGVFSRRTAVWPIAATACLGAALSTLALALIVPGDPTRSDLLWGLLAGVGSGTGTAFLYRGFANGRMGVVAPVSAVGAAVLPASVAVLSGERPSLLAWVGIAVALPGIWLVSREPGQPERLEDHDRPARLAGGLVDGLVAGAGFGLMFAAIGQVPGDAGYWPLMASQVVSIAAVLVMAKALGADPVPRRRPEWSGLLSGALATLAVVAFLLATDQGLLSVAAVLTSLYPAFTVLLAIAFLGERLHRSQSIGLALCAVTVACVAAG